ncbi:MAG: tRNA (adenosine(37)-N6)-threonylcarbamoyltransferase complex dimerization subunit type 1 TsaB [Clostridia bacterium]|nr:tRNA (adenosine(37)-N6)-threonylcarbamoyltransferase complex dimerization subunit type 1 TsaB [Clostridia bacterium]
MKNFLAIDTSCEYFTAVAAKDGEIFTSFLADCAMKHSVSLLPAIDELLQRANLRLEDCDFFAAVVGAGSFTGIRIGISAIKGFCSALGKPALPVTSFDVAAYNTMSRTDGKLLCLVDAGHDAYYACGYGEQGEIVYPPAYITEAEALALQADGYTLCATSDLPLGSKAELKIVDPVVGLQNATLALSKRGAFGELDALYIRKSSAELNQGGK